MDAEQAVEAIMSQFERIEKRLDAITRVMATQAEALSELSKIVQEILKAKEKSSV
jgi:hypothetical protein